LQCTDSVGGCLLLYFFFWRYGEGEGKKKRPIGVKEKKIERSENHVLHLQNSRLL
jgi:hypothetical protein